MLKKAIVLMALSSPAFADFYCDDCSLLSPTFINQEPYANSNTIDFIQSVVNSSGSPSDFVICDGDVCVAFSFEFYGNYLQGDTNPDTNTEYENSGSASNGGGGPTGGLPWTGGGTGTGGGIGSPGPWGGPWPVGGGGWSCSGTPNGVTCRPL